MNSAKFVFAFSLGAAVGAVVSWRILKAKYDQIIEEEAESFRELLARERAKTCDGEDAPDPVEEVTEVEAYANKVAEAGYVKYSNIKENKGGDTDVNDEKPYRVIEPEEFGEEDGYERVSLTYYADGVLTDEMDEIVDDVEGTVGVDSLTHFGEYEDDSVFVRNDTLKIDYEILKDQRKYSDRKRPAYPHWEEE